MLPLRILHIASFSGNIGDNANHLGFYPWVEALSERPVEWTKLEIRHFYWGERTWDEDFVAYANSFDALVIGGGNYFELWVENSPTGTFIAIAPELWEKLTIPIYFNALGVDPGQGVPEVCRARFTEFLDFLLANTKILVSVRNDGACNNLATHIGEKYAQKVLHAPDNGFFAEFKPATSLSYFSDPNVNRIVTMNIASDMPETRFSGYSDGVEGFATEYALMIEDLSKRDPSLGFLFAPHIFRDLDVVNRVIDKLSDRLRRTRIAQVPYGTGDAMSALVFGIYAASDVCVGMRFHANVVPLGSLCQTIGLVSYPQISALYEELNQMDRCVDVSQPGFSKVLSDRIMGALHYPETIFTGTPKQACASAQVLRDGLAPRVKAWLSEI